MSDGQRSPPSDSSTAQRSVPSTSVQQGGVPPREGGSRQGKQPKVLTEEERARKTERNRRKRARRREKRGRKRAQEPEPAAAGTNMDQSILSSSNDNPSGKATGGQKYQPSKQRKQNNRTTLANLGAASIMPGAMARAAPAPIHHLPPESPKFNEFPSEIQKHIFDIAYRLSEDYGSPKNWVHISRKVREWIDPFIYESIVLPTDWDSGTTRLKLYEQTFRSKPKEFYTKNVRRIFTNNNEYDNSDFELELLSICDNLTSLECWSDSREELRTILQTKSWPRLKTLCIDLDLLPQDKNTFHLPLFQHVTQLDFCTNEPQLPSWESLSSLQNLTHMRVYTLVQTKGSEFRMAMDQIFAVASEAQKFFPPNLKYFVILVPVDLLYYISSLERDTPEDKRRWELMENIRLGTFDSRVILGCSGNWDDWLDGGKLSDVEEDVVDGLVDYAGFIALLTCPRWPRDHLHEEERDTWAEVVLKDQKRKRLLASQKK